MTDMRKIGRLTARVALLCGCIGAIALGQSAPAKAPAGDQQKPAVAQAQPPMPPEVLQACLRRVSDQDPGTLHVFLRNRSDHPVRLDQVRLNGLPLRIGETDCPADWHALLPSSVAPGRMALLAVKLKQPPVGLTRLALKMDDGTEAQVVTSEAPPALRISSIGFPGGKKIFVYVENCDKAPHTVSAVSTDASAAADGTVFRSVTVPPGDKRCLTLPLAQDVPGGTYVGVQVKTDEGAGACAMVRALNAFPITFEMGYPAWLPEPWKVNSWGDVSPLGGVFWCPAHAHGSWTESVQEILKAREAAQTPVLHMCRRDMSRAWPFFAEAADVCETNFSQLDEDMRKRMSQTQSIRWFGKWTYDCCSPRPFHAMVGVSNWWGEVWSLRRFPVAEEVRLSVYNALACGARGLYYRNRGWTPENPPTAKLLKGLREVSEEVSRLAPILAAGDVVPWASVSQEKVFCGAIACGDEKLVLFLANDDYKSTPDPVNEPFSYTPKKEIAVAIRLPEGLIASHVHDLGGKEVPFTTTAANGAGVAFNVDRLDLATAYVIDLAPEPAAKPAQEAK